MKSLNAAPFRLSTTSRVRGSTENENPISWLDTANTPIAMKEKITSAC